MTTIEYRCPDGTPFPVTFDAPDGAEMRWGLDFEHTPLPMPPLEVEVNRLGVAGAEAAYGDLDFPAPAIFITPSPRTPSGHVYFSRSPWFEENMASIVAACVRLLERFSSAYGVWRDDSLPRVKEVVDLLSTAGAEVPIAHLADRHAYAQNHTMISAFVAYGDLLNLQGICGPLYGTEVELIVNELAVGRGNPTVHVHRQLWDVGQVALSSPAIVAGLHSDAPATTMASLRAGGTEVPFFAALDRFLAEHGLRSEGWLLCQPTWQEQGDGLFTTLRHVMESSATPPEVVLAAAVERREKLAAEVESKLASEQVTAFREGVERLGRYTAVREERAHWQLVLGGAFRLALLRRGQALVDAGALDAADDVLFLLPDEIEEAEASVLMEVATRRRAEYERWLSIPPPPRLGPPEDAPEGGEGEQHSAGDAGALVTGKGVSRGVATGRARIVQALADADDFEAGDVLVCVTTSPPWTPLFSLASAVVADSGDMGSHTAIAAREYGIPCIVGTNMGTTTIADGAIVVVDGLAGTVHLAG